MTASERPSIPDWGVDLPDAMHPGIPRETPPGVAGGAHWTEPERQVGTPSVWSVASEIRPPAVFGTAQPMKGFSGLLRRAAHRIPDHKVRHWLLLLFADRVDVAEHRALRLGPLGLLAAPLMVAGAVRLVTAAMRSRS